MPSTVRTASSSPRVRRRRLELVLFACCVVVAKISNNNNNKKKIKSEFIWAHSSRIQPIMMENSWWQEPEKLATSAVKKQREANAGV